MVTDLRPGTPAMPTDSTATGTGKQQLIDEQQVQPQLAHSTCLHYYHPCACFSLPVARLGGDVASSLRAYMLNRGASHI